MEGIVFRIAQRDDYRGLVEWLVQMSQTPEQHCLHSWAGESVDDLYPQFLGYLDDAELCYVLASRGEEIVGAMGSEYDRELGQGWLHGPHVVSGYWGAIAPTLFLDLLANLPRCIRELSAHLNVENARGCRFYAQQGFKERAHLSYDLCLTATDERVVSDDGGCVPLEEEHEASFGRLYETLFPGADYSTERALRMNGQDLQILVTAKEEEVLGFVVVSPVTEEVLLLGVREDCRRQGYGRRLLVSAVDWLFDQAQVSQVSLSVGQERIHAQSLYESVGFRLRFTGVGLYKTL